MYKGNSDWWVAMTDVYILSLQQLIKEKKCWHILILLFFSFPNLQQAKLPLFGSIDKCFFSFWGQGTSKGKNKTGRVAQVLTHQILNGARSS